MTGTSIDFVTQLFNGIHAGVHEKFDCRDIFHGAVIATSVDNIDSIERIKGVANVWPVQAMSIPRSPHRNGEIKREQPENNSAHQWTGVDLLHKAGMKGKGTKVAVVDTGIDYSHKALGGCFGPGCKVAGGYDLVGPEWNSRSEITHPKQPDIDPRDFQGHGTHVAGIIAGENKFTGVAPEAELLIYKVFSDRSEESDTTEDVLIQAFCDAYSAGADVITASVNRPGGFVDSPWALVASRIAQQGVFVSIAAGNEGQKGPFYSGVGSNGRHVVSVAAVNTTGDPRLVEIDPTSRPAAAYFTSWGPTNELTIKPDIGAPGYDILSTWLDQDFETDSGSSMAAPYIAGIAALYIAEHGGRELHGSNLAIELTNRIISSGQNVAWSTEEIYFNESAPPFQVGSGLVDARKVLLYTTHLSFDQISLLDTELFRPDWDIRITNHANRTVHYTFEHESLPGVEIYDGISDIKLLSKLQPLNISAVVSLPPDESIGSGQTKTFRFKFALPKGVNDNLLPLYSGKILIRGDNDEHFCIPYGGAAYDTEKAFDTMFDGTPMINGWQDGAHWSFDPERRSTDFGDLTCRLSYPCVHLRWDIFEQDWTELSWKYPPEIGKGGYVGSATSVRDADKFRWFDPSLVNINDTVSFPLMRVPRGYQRFWWFGNLSNGTHIAPGNYR
ncbi:hypothetical protein QQS21_008554 [Conoideocrella luteorostrata]|uniref:Peptidase S8/S53 domain-containing protein n=1 Tax=Conoideocrella luteorostrata TaxID=1105319 RepID=A0AAJ0CN34_9HYPO|nr:hypothetical protein QQS21_008554 [Conoideocrella luteorostrata]